MNDKVFVRDNDTIRRNENLYLDSKTSDVCFVFSSETERVPAHKCILSIVSPVFDAMFYGSMIEKDDVLIVDASAAAFKEFLQFFYLSKVELTLENIGIVTNLCNKYELNEALKVCEAPLQMSLKNKDLCWGLEIAHFFELDNLKKFCEQKIVEYPQEILTSDSFLECSRKSVDAILQLVDSECSAQVIINAYTEWAKAECDRNDLETSTENLRTILGDLFNRFRLDEITMDQFFEYISKYVGMVSDEKIDTITRTIARNKFQSSSFVNAPLSILPKLECDRRDGNNSFQEMNYGFTCLVPNKTLLLTEFYLPRISTNNGVSSLDVFVTINGPYGFFHGELAIFERTTLSSEKETRIVLRQPLVVEEEKGYGISVLQTNFEYFKDFVVHQVKPLLSEIKLKDGIEIKFTPGSELISRITFLQPSD